MQTDRHKDAETDTQDRIYYLLLNSNMLWGICSFQYLVFKHKDIATFYDCFNNR